MSRKKPSTPSPLPSKADILAFLKESSNRVSKRDIARAFKIKGADRPAFKALMRELEQEGHIERKKHRRFAETGRLPEVAVLDAVRLDGDGELIAHPADWDVTNAPPLIIVHASKASGRAVGVGDRFLGRLSSTGDDAYAAHPIRKLTGGPRQILGVCEKSDRGGFILKPINRRDRQTVMIAQNATLGAKHGELVLVNAIGGARRGVVQGRVVERLHDANAERALSLYAIHNHDIPHVWPAAALEEAEACGPAKLGNRQDLRKVPLVTIDGSDARDFDDAVWAEPDENERNAGGWHIMVAIADVSWYVRPDSALDRVAYERGNSTYFPDRVVPMLPEQLSNGWCSLRPQEDRPCLAVELWINKTGKLLKHKFVRGLMRSTARLTYEQVQSAFDGSPDDTTAPLRAPVIEPLYKAYACLNAARQKRGALDLDIPERRILINESGDMMGVSPRERLDSHQLIEEFMVLANIAAAQALQNGKSPGMYRVHEPPDGERVDALRTVLKGLGLPLNPSGSIRPKDFNGVLRQVRNEPSRDLINMMVLRAQTQARYEPNNLGHFGLALSQYTHFTSPIRRYSDLVVHRLLVDAFNLGAGGYGSIESNTLDEIADYISNTERRSERAERETVDRYTASFLSEQIGAQFAGKVNGVSRFGLFITLDETGADGLVPIKRLPRDYYDVFEDTHTLAGRHSGFAFTVGDPITVTLVEADIMTGSLSFDYLDHTHVGGKQRPAAEQPKRHKQKTKGRQKRQKRGRNTSK